MQSPGATFSSSANGRVFVIEPDEVIRSALYFILRDAYETHAFLAPDQAMIGAAESGPDVIVLGMSVVRSHGESIVSEIAARLPDAKLLLLTDVAGDPLARRCLDRGVHGLIGKPITGNSVLDKVDALLGRGNITTAPLGQLAAAGI